MQLPVRTPGGRRDRPSAGPPASRGLQMHPARWSREEGDASSPRQDRRPGVRRPLPGYWSLESSLTPNRSLSACEKSSASRGVKDRFGTVTYFQAHWRKAALSGTGSCAQVAVASASWRCGTPKIHVDTYRTSNAASGVTSPRRSPPRIWSRDVGYPDRIRGIRRLTDQLFVGRESGSAADMVRPPVSREDCVHAPTAASEGSGVLRHQAQYDG